MFQKTKILLRNILLYDTQIELISSKWTFVSILPKKCLSKYLFDNPKNA